MNRILNFILILLPIAILLSCEKTDDPPKEEAVVHIVPVETQVLTLQNVSESITLSSVLEPIRKVEIISEASGKVTAIYAHPGDRVTPADTLARIDDQVALSNYRQARAQLLTAENNLAIAMLNLRSDEQLFKNGDISELAWRNSQLAVKSAEADKLAAQAALQLMEKTWHDTRIVSPVKGVIARKYTDLGAMVNPGTALYRVVDNSVLKAIVGVPQEMISMVRVGSDARIFTSANARPLSGKITYLAPQANEDNGAFDAEIHIKNAGPGRLPSGMTARIELQIASADKQLVIPNFALFEKNGQPSVYRVHGSVANLVAVEVGRQYGKHMVINSGLAAGDTIVVVGMKNLGENTRIRIEEVH